MARILRSSLCELRQRPIAACLASLFALSAPTVALAGTVTSCNDDADPGTLRNVIATTPNGGTVDFIGSTCQTITLVGSQISIAQGSLTIDDTAGQYQVTIDASGLTRDVDVDSRVMSHAGTGELLLKRLILTNGYVSHSAADTRGGCLYSAGNVTLYAVSVYQCTGKKTGNATLNADGGAVWVKGNLTLQNASIGHSSAYSHSPGIARGGGAYVKGDLSMDGSGIYNNEASAGGNTLGGGAFVGGNLNVTDTGKYTTISNNSANSISGMSKGGGLYGAGIVGLHSYIGLHEKSRVTYNTASASAGVAAGGGIYAVGELTLASSIVTHNNADGPNGIGSKGGGIYAKGNTSISYSSINYNKVFGNSAYGGGMHLIGATNSIVSSTIANNVSEHKNAGVSAYGQGAGILFELKNSTISGNAATDIVGGLFVDAASVKLFNSTIAFNTEADGDGASAGVTLSAHYNPVAANLQSTLISNNTYLTTQSDLTIDEFGNLVTFNGGALSTPANNLVRATLVAKLPTDTKIGVCPHLGPLRDNGGLTLTHALMSHSEAIDAGNDSSLSALYDQRGSAVTNGHADYTRFAGLTAIADIGAYEVQHDILFNNDFDDCSP